MATSPRQFRPSLEMLEGRLTPADSTTPGALTFPYPTLNNLSVEWLIDGDDDLDATVAVRYRVQGTSPWNNAMNLLRVPAGSTGEGFTWVNRFAGSILDVQAATTYEIELTLTDPDGGSLAPQVHAVTTRAVPTPMAGAPVFTATPATLNSILSNAQPGDIIELGAGSYAPFTVNVSGLPGMPIVIRDSNGDAAINGPGGLGNAIEARDDSYLIFSGLTINNGRVRVDDSNHVAIIGCTFNASGDGIIALSSAENLYIADNRLIGPATWIESNLGASGFDGGEGISIAGAGHVVENNFVKGFRDLISLRESTGLNQRSIDILNNDLTVGTDDAIEADFSEGNVRVMRNRITNCFIGISSQPGLGGPAYFIRNVQYNVILTSFKLQRGSVGDVLLHNTVVKNGDAFAIYTSDVFSRQFARNNLFIGGGGDTYNGFDNGSGRITDLDAASPTASFNYDAFGSTNGMFQGSIGSNSYSSLAQMQANTTETNAVAVSMSAFAVAVTHPATKTQVLTELATPDLRLGSGNDAIDSGLVIPNVNDGFAGSGPERGAYEVGAALPVYGPRVPATPPIPVAWWQFSESSGSTAADSAGSHSATLFNGPAFVPSGRPGGGNALQFDGVNDFARVADAADLDNAQKLTISFWMNPANLNGRAQGLVSKRFTQTRQNAYSLFLNASNRLSVDLVGKNNRFSSNTVFSANQWYHIALTFDGTAAKAQRVKLYVNGVLDRTAAETSIRVPNRTARLFFGILNAGSKTRFQGMLDDIRIHRAALSQAEIQALM